MQYNFLISGLLTASVGWSCFIFSLIKKHAKHSSVINSYRINNIESVLLQRIFGSTTKNSIIKFHRIAEEYAKNPYKSHNNQGLAEILSHIVKTRKLKDLVTEWQKSEPLFKLLLYLCLVNYENRQLSGSNSISESNRSILSGQRLRQFTVDYAEIESTMKSLNLSEDLSSVVKVIHMLCERLKGFLIIESGESNSLSVVVKALATIAEVHSRIHEMVSSKVSDSDMPKFETTEIIDFISKNVLGRQKVDNNKHKILAMMAS